MRNLGRSFLLVALAAACLLSVFAASASANGTPSIAGTVTEAGTNLPLEGIEVCASDPLSHLVFACEESAADGGYEIEALEARTYVVEFAPNYEGDYLWQAYDGKGPREGTPITLAADEARTGVDAVLQKGGRIAGKVTDRASGTPLAGITVCPITATVPHQGQECATTDGEGEYTSLPLAPGSYVVQFVPEYTSFYEAEFLQEKRFIQNAASVAVQAGQTTPGVSEALLKGGNVSGTVTDAKTGAGIYQFVCAEKIGDAEIEECALTSEADGTYTIHGLPAGTYKVHFVDTSGAHHLDQYYDNAARPTEADPVAVAIGGTTEGIDAAMYFGSTVSGQVIDFAEGEPLAGAEVCLYQGSGDQQTFECTTTDGEGEYAFVEQRPGEYVALFKGPGGAGFETKAYDERASLGEADPIVVGPEEDVEEIDATLAQAGTISGEVTDAASGDPVDRTVKACAESTSGTMPTLCAEVEDGKYEIQLAGPGEFVVSFAASCGEGTVCPGYLFQYYDGVDEKSEATALSVATEEDVEGVDAAMVIPAAPVLETPPSIGGTAAVGQKLSCDHGSWKGEPTKYRYAWLRDGQAIAGAATSSYTVVDADAGHSLVCRVTASNQLGSTAADSAAVGVPASTPNTPPAMPPGAGPTPAPAGTAAAKASAKVKGGKALLSLNCAGAGPCAGTLKLTGKSKGKNVLLGKAKFSVAAGKSATVKVKLGTAALALLEAAGAKGLKVKLGGSGIGARSLTLKSSSH